MAQVEGMSRWHLKTMRDANQPSIVAELVKVGCTVADTSAAGAGFPDLIVKFRDVLYMIEIKNPEAARRSKSRELTPAQVAFHAKWGCVHVVETPADALRVVGVKP